MPAYKDQCPDCVLCVNAYNSRCSDRTARSEWRLGHALGQFIETDCSVVSVNLAYREQLPIIIFEVPSRVADKNEVR
jgi:hypothetical protein